METTMKLKLKKSITCLAIIIFNSIYIAPIQAQDKNKAVDNTSTRLKSEENKTVKKKDELRDKLKVKATHMKGTSKAKIKFVPFKLVDENGKDIPPNREVTLQNGEIVTAQEAMDRKNKIEKKMAKLGDSSNNKTKNDNYSIVRGSYVKIKND